MTKFIKDYLKKTSIRVVKSDFDVWMVKRNSNVLYMGSKEKCDEWVLHMRAA